MRIRFFFIFPGERASVSCPLSSRTRNRASGSSSITVPSNSIRSSFGKEFSFGVASKEEGAPKRPFKWQPGSSRMQIDSRHAPALTLLELVVQLLALLKAIHAGSLDRGNVHENVGSSICRLNKTVTLLGIEPLDRAGRH